MDVAPLSQQLLRLLRYLLLQQQVPQFVQEDQRPCQLLRVNLVEYSHGQLAQLEAQLAFLQLLLLIIRLIIP